MINTINKKLQSKKLGVDNSNVKLKSRVIFYTYKISNINLLYKRSKKINKVGILIK